MIILLAFSKLSFESFTPYFLLESNFRPLSYFTIMTKQAVGKIWRKNMLSLLSEHRQKLLPRTNSSLIKKCLKISAFRGTDNDNS